MTTYYSSCNNSNQSLVDALKQIGVDSSFANREKIANLNGISNYGGTPDQNNTLLNLLKNGKLIKSKGETSSSNSNANSNLSNEDMIKNIDNLVKRRMQWLS